MIYYLVAMCSRHGIHEERERERERWGRWLWAPASWIFHAKKSCQFLTSSELIVLLDCIMWPQQCGWPCLKGNGSFEHQDWEKPGLLLLLWGGKESIRKYIDRKRTNGQYNLFSMDQNEFFNQHDKLLKRSRLCT